MHSITNIQIALNLVDWILIQVAQELWGDETKKQNQSKTNPKPIQNQSKVPTAKTNPIATLGLPKPIQNQSQWPKSNPTPTAKKKTNTHLIQKPGPQKQ